MADAPLSHRERPIDRILLRPLSDAALDRNTESVARPPSSPVTDGETLLYFEHYGEALALPAVNAARAFLPLRVHRVPHRPGPIFRGVTSERGELRLVADLAAALELQPSSLPSDPARRRMILVDCDGEQWLVEVDAITGVRRSQRDAWIDPPATISHGRGRMTAALVPIGPRRAALLDPARLVASFRGSIS